jgi:hypothetical protein
MTVDELRNEMHAEFEDVRADVAGLREKMATEFRDVRAEMKADGEATRRHFDVMVEAVKDVVKIVADGTVRNTERLDDHENRLKAIEPAR